MDPCISPRLFGIYPSNFAVFQTSKTTTYMEAITDLFSPEQIDAILAAYDSVAAWYAQAADFAAGLAESAIIEDVWI